MDKRKALLINTSSLTQVIVTWSKNAFMPSSTDKKLLCPSVSKWCSCFSIFLTNSKPNIPPDTVTMGSKVYPELLLLTDRIPYPMDKKFKHTHSKTSNTCLLY